MRAVALLPCAAILTGAWIGVHLDAPPGARAALPVVWIAAASWWLVAAGHPDRERRGSPVIAALLAAGFLFGAWTLGADARTTALHSPLRRVVDVESATPVVTRGVLREDAASVGSGVSLRVRVVAVRIGNRWVDTDGGVLVTVGGQPPIGRMAAWRAGRTIDAPMQFRRPALYFNDGVPDFERDVALGGTTLFASVKSALLVDVVAPGSAFDESAASIRAVVRAAVTRWVSRWDPVAGAIVTAVLIGDRTGLPDEIRDRLQAAGTYHVIAISGGNIAILAAAIVIALMCLLVRGRLAAFLTIVALLGYAEVVTAGPSVWRATVMAIIYLTARLFDHRAPAWQTTTVAASVMAIAEPLDIRNAGFLLTFGATIALIEVAGRAVQSMTRQAGSVTATSSPVTARALVVRNWIAASLAASLATELALMPVSAVVFSRITLAGPLLNLVAVPVMAVVQIAGMAVVATERVASIARPSGWLAYAGASALTGSARLIDIARWLTLHVPPPAMWLVAAYYAGLLLAVRAPRSWSRRLGVAVAIVTGAAIVSGAGVGARRPASGTLRWTAFDVGQGESTLLQWGGSDLLVDTGGAPFGGGFDVGGRVLAPALWARGVRSLLALAITHGDPDHIGGALSIVDAFSPASLWLGVPVPPHRPTRDLVARAAAGRIRVEDRRAGETLAFDGLQLRVLNPAPPDWERRRVRNDDSLVVEARYGDVAILLTGDISAEVERAIVPQLEPAPIRILKVAHHGSRTSTSAELLDAWRPQIAVVSCGRGNTFGHPAPEVVARLEALGARIYRTDRDGEVTVETDGRSVSVRTYVGGQP